MRMTRTLYQSRAIYQEWRLFCSNRTNLLVLAGLLALLLLAAYNSVSQVRSQHRDLVQAQTDALGMRASQRQDLLAVIAGQRTPGEFDDPRKATRIAQQGTTLFKPPLPLAVLSRGGELQQQVSHRITMASRHSQVAIQLEYPANRLDGVIDLAFVTAWLLPLILLALSYDVLARDREARLTPLLASQAGSLYGILWRRLALRLGLVLLCVLLVVVPGVALTQTPIQTQGTGLSWLAELGFWLLVLLCNLVFWLAVAAWINARAASGATACLALLLVWIGVTLLVPVAASQLATRLAPPPDRLAFILEKRALDTELTRAVAEIREGYYAQRPENRPEAGVANEYEAYFISNYYPRQLAFDRQFGPLAERVEQQQQAQMRYFQNFGLASPPLSLKLLSDALAGRDPWQEARFRRAQDQAIQDWRAHFDHKFAAMRMLQPEDLERAPHPEFVPESSATRLRRLLPNLLCTLMIAAAVAGLALWLTRRTIRL